MSAAQLYERVAAATCPHHGFDSEADREAHIRSIVTTVLKAKGLA